MNELIRKLNEQAQDWADAHAPVAMISILYAEIADAIGVE